MHCLHANDKLALLVYTIVDTVIERAVKVPPPLQTSTPHWNTTAENGVFTTHAN